MWLYNLNNTLFLSICLKAEIMRENSGDCNFRAIVFDIYMWEMEKAYFNLG